MLFMPQSTFVSDLIFVDVDYASVDFSLRLNLCRCWLCLSRWLSRLLSRLNLCRCWLCLSRLLSPTVDVDYASVDFCLRLSMLTMPQSTFVSDLICIDVDYASVDFSLRLSMLTMPQSTFVSDFAPPFWKSPATIVLTISVTHVYMALCFIISCINRSGEIFSLYFGTTLVIVFSSYDIMKETFIKQADIFSDKPKNGFIPILPKVNGWYCLCV